jgi:hypothetical protein
LYPYLLVEAGKQYLNGGLAFRPEQIQMMYWYTAFPNEPIVFVRPGYLPGRSETYLEMTDNWKFVPPAWTVYAGQLMKEPASFAFTAPYATAA